MTKFFSCSCLVAILAIVCCGCADAPATGGAESGETPATNGDHGHDHDDADHDGDEHAGHDADGHAHGKLCGSCGVEKGTEQCCSDSAERCECGKIKGSTLCCVKLDESAEGKDLCGKCGQVAGADSCCKDDAEKCACGMAKGSPLCCKLKKDAS